MTTKTFKRTELKYLINSKQYKVIIEELKKHMSYDPFCRDGNKYMIYNLYFDTNNDDVIKHSLSKPYYKEKLRLRSYKMPTEQDDIVFLELKKKIGGVVAKRRAIMHYHEAIDLVENRIVPYSDNYQDVQVISEILAFLAQYPVYPKVYISYERLAFFGNDDKDFRVSFDMNILTRRDKVNLYEGDFGTELIGDNTYLMEIKCNGAMPVWLSHLLSECHIYRCSFSKYGSEYKNYRINTTFFVA